MFVENRRRGSICSSIACLVKEQITRNSQRENEKLYWKNFSLVWLCAWMTEGLFLGSKRSIAMRVKAETILFGIADNIVGRLWRIDRIVKTIF